MEAYLGMWLGFISVLGGFAIAFYAVWLKSKAREMRHRERMAMIEKGLVPPGVDEASMSIGGGGGAFRSRRDSGIMMICIGIGLAMLFGFASGGWRNVWIGGFIAMIGVANLVIALMHERDRRAAPSAGPQNTSSPDREISS